MGNNSHSMQHEEIRKNFTVIRNKSVSEVETLQVVVYNLRIIGARVNIMSSGIQHAWAGGGGI